MLRTNALLHMSPPCRHIIKRVPHWYSACLAIASALFVFQPSLGFAETNAHNCHSLLLLTQLIEAQSHGLHKMMPDQRHMFAEMIRLAGRRALQSGPEQWRVPKFGKQSLFWPPEDNNKKGIEFFWTLSSKPITFKEFPDRIRVYVPQGFRVDDVTRIELHQKLKQALVGHDLHPFVRSNQKHIENAELGEAPLVIKQSQIEMAEAFNQSMSRGDKRFLGVGPTGFGKTWVLMQMLKRLLSASHTSNQLVILIADQTALVQDLTNNVENLKSELKSSSVDFNLVQWGGDLQSSDMRTFIYETKNSQKPTVLVTTIQALRKRIGIEGGHYDEFTENITDLAKLVSGILYDEAHHSGAELSKEIINGVINYRDPKSGFASKAIVAGVTATPDRQDQVDLVADIFGNNAFYAYLDSVDSYLHNPGNLVRPLSDTVDQFVRAIVAGELTPVRTSSYEASYFDRGKGDFYIKEPELGEKTPLEVINPDYYNDVLDFAHPMYQEHDHVLTITNGVHEAMRVAQELAKRYPNKVVKALHSDLKSEESLAIYNAIKDGSVNIVVSIRQFDEGIDAPHFSGLHLLSKSTYIPRLFQRMGRVVRLFQNKRIADVVLPLDLTVETARDQLTFLQGLKEIQKILRSHGSQDFQSFRISAHSGTQNKITELPKKILSDGNRHLDEMLRRRQNFVQDLDTVREKQISEIATQFDRALRKLKEDGTVTWAWISAKCPSLKSPLRRYILEDSEILLSKIKDARALKFVKRAKEGVRYNNTLYTLIDNLEALELRLSAKESIEEADLAKAGLLQSIRHYIKNNNSQFDELVAGLHQAKTAIENVRKKMSETCFDVFARDVMALNPPSGADVTAAEIKDWLIKNRLYDRFRSNFQKDPGSLFDVLPDSVNSYTLSSMENAAISTFLDAQDWYKKNALEAENSQEFWLLLKQTNPTLYQSLHRYRNHPDFGDYFLMADPYMKSVFEDHFGVFSETSKTFQESRVQYSNKNPAEIAAILLNKIETHRYTTWAELRDNHAHLARYASIETRKNPKFFNVIAQSSHLPLFEAAFGKLTENGFVKRTTPKVPLRTTFTNDTQRSEYYARNLEKWINEVWVAKYEEKLSRALQAGSSKDPIKYFTCDDGMLIKEALLDKNSKLFLESDAFRLLMQRNQSAKIYINHVMRRN